MGGYGWSFQTKSKGMRCYANIGNRPIQVSGLQEDNATRIFTVDAEDDDDDEDDNAYDAEDDSQLVEPADYEGSVYGEVVYTVS